MVLSLDRWYGKIAIVTGASVGIGAAIVEKLVQHGIVVVGLARRLEKLQELGQKVIDNKSKGKLYPFKCDMTKEEDILAAFKWTKDNLGTVQILINNAGLKIEGDLYDAPTETWRTVLDTNVIGLCIATREAVKQLKETNAAGQIIHINSVLGHNVYNIPKINVYSASKHAVTALTETLRLELMNLDMNVKITSVSPGPVDTEFHALTTGPIPVKKFLHAEDVANAVEYVLSTPPQVQVQELILRPLNEFL